MTREFEGEDVRTTLRAKCVSEMCVRTASFPGTEHGQESVALTGHP